MSPDSRLKRLALTTASIFLLFVGILLGVPQMYLMAVAVSLIPLIYWFVGLVLLRGIICERKMPTSCQRGERVKIDLVLTNKTLFSRFYIRALDRLPRWTKFDGYEAGHSAILLSLRPGDKSHLSYFIRPYRRGPLLIGPTKLSNPDLIGLSSYSRTINTPHELLVYPDVIPISARFFSGGGAHGWMDQENAATRGTGSDFQGVREYRTGDDLRRVNWKTTARTGSLAVTEYALGYVSDFTIALDLSPESYGFSDDSSNSAFETAIEIAASLAIAGLKQGSSVEIIANGDLLPGDAPLRGVESSLAVLTSFAMAQMKANERFVSVLNKFSISKSQDRCLIVVTGAAPGDAALNGTLEQMRSARKGASAMIFWIDCESFDGAAPFQFQSPTDGRRRFPEVFGNATGKNVIVRADTDLKELFAGALL